MNIEDRKAKQKEYYYDHREEKIASVVKYQLKQRKNNPKYRITSNTRALMSASLKKSKTSHTLENRIGCSIEVLKEHLLSTIEEGYIWKDYLSGDLILEHIIPISKYSYTSYDDVEFLKCWNYRNLRLLTPINNTEKGTDVDLSLITQYCLFDLLPESLSALKMD